MLQVWVSGQLTTKAIGQCLDLSSNIFTHKRQVIGAFVSKMFMQLQVKYSFYFHFKCNGYSVQETTLKTTTNGNSSN